MNKYIIEVTEISQKRVEVVSESEEQAIQTVEQMYKDEEIILDYTDFVDVDFSIIREDV
jgi:hypothetical protein